MQYKDYLLRHTGFINKRNHEQRLLRRAVARLLEPYAAKGQKIDEFRMWPVNGDDKLKKLEKEFQQERMMYVEEEALKTLRRFKELEAAQNSKEN